MAAKTGVQKGEGRSEGSPALLLSRLPTVPPSPSRVLPAGNPTRRKRAAWCTGPIRGAAVARVSPRSSFAYLSWSLRPEPREGPAAGGWSLADAASGSSPGHRVAALRASGGRHAGDEAVGGRGVGRVPRVAEGTPRRAPSAAARPSPATSAPPRAPRPPLGPRASLPPPSLPPALAPSLLPSFPPFSSLLGPRPRSTSSVFSKLPRPGLFVRLHSGDRLLAGC